MDQHGLANCRHLLKIETVSLLLLLTVTAVAGPNAKPVVLGPELSIQTIESGVYLVVHRFPGACNSLLVQCAPRDFVWVDTALTDDATRQVHQWLKQRYRDPNVLQINTGFHNDNLAGNGYLIKEGVPCYGSDLTPQLIKERWPETVKMCLPYYERAGEPYRQGFLEPLAPPNKLYPLKEGFRLQVGQESVEVYFPGASHTLDNVVVYFEKKQILYGGCMIKAAQAQTPGFTGDADMEAWPGSVRKVLERYPDARLVVPGHGHWGDHTLTRHTIKLLTRTAQED